MSTLLSLSLSSYLLRCLFLNHNHNLPSLVILPFFFFFFFFSALSFVLPSLQLIIGDMLLSIAIVAANHWGCVSNHIYPRKEPLHTSFSLFILLSLFVMSFSFLEFTWEHYFLLFCVFSYLLVVQKMKELYQLWSYTTFDPDIQWFCEKNKCSCDHPGVLWDLLIFIEHLLPAVFRSW